MLEAIPMSLWNMSRWMTRPWSRYRKKPEISIDRQRGLGRSARDLLSEDVSSQSFRSFDPGAVDGGVVSPF